MTYEMASTRRPDTLDERVSVVIRQSPVRTLRFVSRVLWAKWQLRRASSVGKYVKLVGRLRVVNRGRLAVGDRVLFHSFTATTELVVAHGAELVIGNGAFVNYGAEICAHKRIVIGDECRIGTHCIMMDNDFHYVELARRDEMPPSEEIVIEPHVWIGNRVTVLKGVRIGYGSVVAAGSVVNKSIPPMSVAAGVPAKVIRSIDGSSASNEWESAHINASEWGSFAHVPADLERVQNLEQSAV
jgi:acetyltransferase-like isoleucine patch superfamily enzyme